MSRPVLILFGSQSGNSEDLALKLAKYSTNHNLTPTVVDMENATVEQMASSERILIICSTWGEGEMPDSAEALWDSISVEDAPKMENTHFSICALGDTSYEFYCQSGKDWDRRLEELGAKRVFARQDCDLDFDEPYSAWAEGALPAISSAGGDAAEVIEEASVGEESQVENVIESSDELNAIIADGDRKLVILFGSQSGNSEDLAFRIQVKSKEFGLNAEVFDMEGFDLGSLVDTTRLLIICSTWGEGDMPDSAEALWDLANSNKRPKLIKTHFSVCALGDTSYEFYCQSGKEWDKVIEDMGGVRVYDRADCDVDFDPTYEKWVIPALASVASVDGNGIFNSELVQSFIERVDSKGVKSATEDLDTPVISRPPISISFEIFRYNPAVAESGKDTFECKMPGHFSILDALESIKSDFDPTLSFRRSGPLSGVIVNGAVVRADRTRLLDLVKLCGEVLSIEPLPGYEVVKDLVISTKNYDNHRARSKPWMVPATRSGMNTSSGVSIGIMDSANATHLHALGDIDSPQLLHSYSDTIPYDSEYMGPSLVMHTWKRINDERLSEKARLESFDLLQNEGGIWSESDTGVFRRHGNVGRSISNSFNDCRSELLRLKGFSGKHGRLVKWYGLSVKWSGKVNETTLYRQVLGPLGLVSNLFSGVSMRMMLGFTRTGAKPFRGILPLLAPPAGIGKIPPMINSKVESHHEVANLFNKLDNRF